MGRKVYVINNINIIKTVHISSFYFEFILYLLFFKRNILCIPFQNDQLLPLENVVASFVAPVYLYNAFL